MGAAPKPAQHMVDWGSPPVLGGASISNTAVANGCFYLGFHRHRQKHRPAHTPYWNDPPKWLGRGYNDSASKRSNRSKVLRIEDARKKRDAA